MHARTNPWRHIVAAIALVLLALPLSTPVAGSAVAQVSSPAPSSIPSSCTPSTGTTLSASCYVDVTPAVSFDMLFTLHNFTFTCDARTSGLYGLGGTASSPTTPPGCYNVTASVTDEATHVLNPLLSADCGIWGADGLPQAADCTNVVSPICPVGEDASPFPSPTVPCNSFATGGSEEFNSARVWIDPGPNHPYRIEFDGYIPTTSLGDCPVGTTYQPGVVLTESFGLPPMPAHVALPTAPGGACRFAVRADETYVEITQADLTTQPPNRPCGGPTLLFPPLKAHFGPACRLTGATLGATLLKFGVDCSTEPPTGTPAPRPYPPGSIFACFNRILVIYHILLQGTSLTYTLTGPGSFNMLQSPIAAIFARIGRCAGVPGGNARTVAAGAVLTMCPTGSGTVAVRACLAGATENQPPICSNTIYARYGP